MESVVWWKAAHRQLAHNRKSERAGYKCAQTVSHCVSVSHFCFWQKEVRLNTSVGRHRLDREEEEAAGGSKIALLNPAIVSNTHSMVGGGVIMRDIKDSDADKR